MRGPGPAAGAPVAVATLPSRGLPRPVQFSVAKSVQNSMAIDTGSLAKTNGLLILIQTFPFPDFPKKMSVLGSATDEVTWDKDR